MSVLRIPVARGLMLALSAGLFVEAGAQPISNPDAIDSSPVRGIDRESRRDRGVQRPPPTPADIQSIDGTGNNLRDLDMGASDTPIERRLRPAYADGVSDLSGAARPTPRAISNGLHAQVESFPNSQRYSDLLWQWGQFIDHDFTLTDGVEPAEHVDIPIPAGDEYFDPLATGTAVISFNRSLYDHESGTDTNNPRQQVNEITAWIDASMVYGSDTERASALRTLDGSGTMKVSAGNLLPYNVDGFPNAGGHGDNLFFAGDVRANEQLALTVMHTLFVREHNRLAAGINQRHSALTGEQVYQQARRLVIATIQSITYNEFLPKLLGRRALEPYRGYNPGERGAIRNVFSNAAFRLGHTMLSPIILRLDEQGEEIEAGLLSLADAFFRPDRLLAEGGVEPILRGMSQNVCQTIDVFVVDEVRNFLFGIPGSGGFDLASLNIQRGRDHGFPDYNSARAAYGLAPATVFSDITDDPETVERLAIVYGSPDDMDIWSAGLAETHAPGAIVGPLFRAMLIEQFRALRDGDRFWYENVLSQREIARIRSTRLADIIRRNTDIGDEISDDVFRVARN